LSAFQNRGSAALQGCPRPYGRPKGLRYQRPQVILKPLLDNSSLQNASRYHAGLRESWDRRIRRAEQLASDGGPAEALLTFYARLLRSQQTLYESLKTQALGAFVRDLASIRPAAWPRSSHNAGHGTPRSAH
jgi:hypothetical protein